MVSLCATGPKKEELNLSAKTSGPQVIIPKIHQKSEEKESSIITKNNKILKFKQISLNFHEKNFVEGNISINYLKEILNIS